MSKDAIQTRLVHKATYEFDDHSLFSGKTLHNMSLDFWFDPACNNQNHPFLFAKNTGEQYHPVTIISKSLLLNK